MFSYNILILYKLLRFYHVYIFLWHETIPPDSVSLGCLDQRAHSATALLLIYPVCFKLLSCWADRSKHRLYLYQVGNSIRSILARWDRYFTYVPLLFPMLWFRQRRNSQVAGVAAPVSAQSGHTLLPLSCLDVAPSRDVT